LRQVSSALLLVSVSMATASAWAGCELSQMQIPVRIVDFRPIATLTLNGTEVPMLVDSGAFFSMLSASTAAQLKLPLRKLPAGLRLEGYTGPIEAKQTRVEKMGLLGAELTNVEFLVGGNELGAGIMGVLGRDILSMADTEYDLAQGVVRLSFPKGECDKTNLAYWAGEAPVIMVPLDWEQHRADTAIRIYVSINGTRTLTLLDTGAPRTSLTLKAARRAGIEERDLTPSGRVGGAGEGRVKSWTGNVAMVELGGEKIANIRLQIDDADRPDHGLVVGLDYFCPIASTCRACSARSTSPGTAVPYSRRVARRRETTMPVMRRCRRTSRKTTPTRWLVAAPPPSPRGITSERWKT
jgi:predicted aspartyl protease